MLSVSSSALFTTGQQLLVDGLTLVRTRGELLVQLLTSDGAGGAGGFRWAAGICIVTENAAGVGVTAVPSPITDLGWDGWLWHQLGNVRVQETTLLGQQLAATVRVPIDSKAMRKMRSLDFIIAAFQVVEVGVSTIEAHLETRMLVKLP